MSINSDSVNSTENSIADNSIGSLPTLGTSSSSVINFSPTHNNNNNNNNQDILSFSNSAFSNSENSPIIINPFSIPEIGNDQEIRTFLLNQTVGDIFLDDQPLTLENYYQYGYLRGYNDCTINSNLNISNGSISSNSTIGSQGPMNIDELVVPEGVELNQLNNSISTMGNTTRSSNADTFSFVDGNLSLGGKKKGKKKPIKKNKTKKKKGKLRKKRVTKRKV